MSDTSIDEQNIDTASLLADTPGDTPGEVAGAGEVDSEQLIWQEDRIGVVVPGAVDGLAALVVRSLGMGDSGRYEGGAVAQVKQRQSEAGLEPNGVVAGATWALVLRKPKLGEQGHEVRILRTLYGLDPDLGYDEELAAIVAPDASSENLWLAAIEFEPVG